MIYDKRMRLGQSCFYFRQMRITDDWDVFLYIIPWLSIIKLFVDGIGSDKDQGT